MINNTFFSIVDCSVYGLLELNNVQNISWLNGNREEEQV